MPRRVIGLLAAAGQGTRLGAALPKAFVDLEGKALISRSAQLLVDSGVIDEIKIVISPEMEPLARELIAAQVNLGQVPVEFVPGGAERADSVWQGLRAIADDPAYVLIHDAARALTPPEMVARVVDKLRAGAAAVVPVLPVTDTIKSVAGHKVTGTLDRASLRAVQTPQGFDLAQLRAANEKYFATRPDFVATDDASLMEWFGARVETVDGDARALKITTPFDLVVARALVNTTD